MYFGRQQVALAVILLGLVLAAIGLILGLTGISTSGVDCGSAFRPDASARYSYSATVGACDDATSSRKAVALALTIPGAVLAVGGLFAVGMLHTEMRSDDDKAPA